MCELLRMLVRVDDEFLYLGQRDVSSSFGFVKLPKRPGGQGSWEGDSRSLTFDGSVARSPLTFQRALIPISQQLFIPGRHRPRRATSSPHRHHTNAGVGLHEHARRSSCSAVSKQAGYALHPPVALVTSLAAIVHCEDSFVSGRLSVRGSQAASFDCDATINPDSRPTIPPRGVKGC